MSNETVWVGYYSSHAKTARNRCLFVAFGNGWEDRILAKRALDFRFARPALPREIEAHKGAKRWPGYKYATLAGLLEDERRVGVDEMTLAKIEAALKPFDPAAQ